MDMYGKETPFGAFDSELMHQEISIPEGFTATIDGNKIILTKTEGEDERIRKYLIKRIISLYGENSSTPEGIEVKDIVTWLEKKGEKPKKTSIKHKPKFKVDDWIIYSNEEVGLITGLADNGYYVDKESYIPFNCEGNMRLWTIRDAKPGDVLVTDFEEDNIILIYHSMCTIDTINVYCCLDNRFVCESLGIFDAKDVKPATKEQRDLLFQKIEESGYKWNAEKKELEKIEQKQDVITQINPSEYINDMGGNGCYLKNATQVSAWTEDDKKHMASILTTLLMEAKNAKIEQYRSSVESDIDWIYSLKNKDRVQPKQWWGEEDEHRIELLEALCEDKLFESVPNSTMYGEMRTTIDWLKSLKDCVQPKQKWSEEDEANSYHLKTLLENLAKDIKHVFRVISDDDRDKYTAWLNSLKDRVQPQLNQGWKQENTSDLTDFENAMMHIGSSFFSQYAGLDPNDTNAIKEQANLLLELVPNKEWSEKDEAKLKSACALIRNTNLNGNEGIEEFTIDWLKSLKDRIQPHPKQQWSELDEMKLNETLGAITGSDYYTIDDKKEIEDWLKSLRNRITWKPSKEQLKSLQEVIDVGHFTSYPNVLETLYEQLEKL